jgi:hypothetical protein
MKPKMFWQICLGLALGIFVFDPGAWSGIASAQGPKPTPPKLKAPTTSVGTAFTIKVNSKGTARLSRVPAPFNFGCGKRRAAARKLAAPSPCG